MTVGLGLLSRLHVDTPTAVTGAYMLVLGLGLGLVIQVLVLAAQNAVDYKYLGVASSGSTLFRQIGGSIGVAVFGAIFANQLASNLVGKLPAGTHVPAAAANPAVVKTLPHAVRDVFVTAITDALTTVLLVAAGIAALAFFLTWLLPEVPLKTTAGATDVGDGLHPSRDDDALREIERALSKLAGRRSGGICTNAWPGVQASSSPRRSCGCWRAWANAHHCPERNSTSSYKSTRSKSPRRSNSCSSGRSSRAKTAAQSNSRRPAERITSDLSKQDPPVFTTS